MDVFSRIKPYCVALSEVAFRAPEAARPALRALHETLIGVHQSSVPQGLANYIFFPLKPLLKPGISEDTLACVFDLITWLLPTQWFVKGDEMTSQMIILLATSLTRAESEELTHTLIKTSEALFRAAGPHLNVLQAKPSLAHLITLLLDVKKSPEIQKVALDALSTLYTQLDGDSAASFLPGTVSSLKKLMMRSGEKSRVLVAGFKVLSKSICACFDGKRTTYRSEQWQLATESQLILALHDALTHILRSNQLPVQDEASIFCKTILDKTSIAPRIFVEYLLHIDIDLIPPNYTGEIEDLLFLHLDCLIGILQGVDEERKIIMLYQMRRAMSRSGPIARTMCSDRLIPQLIEFVKFTKQSSLITALPHEEEPALEPMLEYLSTDCRDELCRLLSVCELSQPGLFWMGSPERFWIALKLNLPGTYEHAIWHLEKQPELAIQGVIKEARRLGFDYRPELMLNLYPFFTLPNLNIYALTEVSKACQYPSLEAMIVDNADYLVNSLDLAFRSCTFTKQTPLILNALVRLAPEMLELVDDVVNTFFEVLDAYHGFEGIVEDIFDALSGVIDVSAKQPHKSAFTSTIEQQVDPGATEDASFEQRFEEVEEGESSIKEIPEEDVDRDSKSYNMVLQILQKAQIFLSHGNNDIKIRVLALIYAGIPTVATNENKYLPLVHEIWPQLTRRLADDSPFVVSSVLSVMARMITFAGSFMRMRINNDVLPMISEVLHPARDKRGNLLHERREWTGAGRRKVAHAIEQVLQAVVEDGGLRDAERTEVLTVVEDLAGRSEVLRKVLDNAKQIDQVGT